MNAMMANSSMNRVVLEVTGKNLRPTTKMVWLVSSCPVINPSIQMGDWSSFLRTSTPMHGKRSYLPSFVQGSWSMGAGPSRRRWVIGLVRSHRLRLHLRSGLFVRNALRMLDQGG